MMKGLPSCSGENGYQSMVSCVYKANLHGRPCAVTITWRRFLTGGFSISIDDDSSSQSLCNVEIKPWLFPRNKGSKTIEEANTNGKLIIDIFWDLSPTEFGSGPEPLESFYVAIVSDHEIVLLLGDLAEEAYQRTEASYQRRKHLFGKRVYATTAPFCDNGQTHEISIECDYMGQKDPELEIKIDKKRVLQVKRLRWNYMGNQTILVDGIPVEVRWDVHGWLFSDSLGNAMFTFQTFLSLSSSQILGEEQLQGLGFSLILHAWKND